jgi:hypothetical protein
VGNDSIDIVDKIGLAYTALPAPKTFKPGDHQLNFRTSPKKDGTVCGKITITADTLDGKITVWFKWEMAKGNPCCLCEDGTLGWVQHIKEGSVWRYDNGAGSTLSGGMGHVSDPDSSSLPDAVANEDGTYAKNPWYGGGGNVQPIADTAWRENPKPQQYISDAYAGAAADFVDQLVCSESGKIYIGFKWRQTASPPLFSLLGYYSYPAPAEDAESDE